MKIFLLIIAVLFISPSALSQTVNPNYDADLASKLGADEYGMKSFVLVVLKTGPTEIADKKIRSEKFKGHFDNIKQLVEEKKLIVAGPFGDNDNSFRGLFILDVKTIKEAKTLLQTDPTISSGIFEAEYYPWYGSAALGEYLNASDKVWKVQP